MPRLVLLASLLLSCTAPAGLHVFAAASLSDALTEIGTAYERATGETVAFNFGASSILARQIASGAPADVFVSADEAKMDWLAGQRLVGPRVRLLSNRLVIVVARDSPDRIDAPEDLVRFRAITIADPASVPAGIYARQWLETRGLWRAIHGRVIPTENVRGAMHAVERGNAGAAIVYATDAKMSRRVRVAYEINDGPPISYPAAVLTSAKDRSGAERFLAFLHSTEGHAVFRKHGFIVPPS